MLLDLSAAFDTVDHPILLHRLSSVFGIQDQALAWVESYLHQRKQFVNISGTHSKEIVQTCNVPQGSVLGPTFFSDYVVPLVHVFEKWNISYHSYADATQVYISFSPDSDEIEARHAQESCLADVRLWMAANFLKLNDDKTDFLLIGNKYNLPKVESTCITIGQTDVNNSAFVKNIGAVIDSQLTMEKHVSITCKSAWHHLFQLSKFRKYLTQDQLTTAVIAYVICKLDQRNSLLVCLPDVLTKKLQRVQNAAARMVTGSKRSDDSKQLLFKLYWLPVSYRIGFKILLLTFKSLHGEGPAYLCELLVPYLLSRSLRSYNKDFLIQPKTRCKYWDRSFSSAAPRLWNSLPACIRSSSGVNSFKKSLKTLLFRLAFAEFFLVIYVCYFLIF